MDKKVIVPVIKETSNVSMKELVSSEDARKLISKALREFPNITAQLISVQSMEQWKKAKGKNEESE